MLYKSIFITTQKEGFHCWPDAPEEVAFLRNLHRHMFGVKVSIQVKHNDRELEFILVKRFVNECLDEIFAKAKEAISCEDIATKLYWKVMEKYSLHDPCEERLIIVQVNEDGENGAFVNGELE